MTWWFHESHETGKIPIEHVVTRAGGAAVNDHWTLGTPISPEFCADLVRSAGRQPHPWLDLDPVQIRTAYNRRPFLLSHRLSEHPHFTLAALSALCRRLGTDHVSCRIGKVPVDAEFDSSLQRYNHGLALDDAIEHLEEREAYIAVYNPERDAEYRPVIEGLVGEIALQTEQVEPGMNWYSTYLFISARDSVTPYHMDREMNFLLQVRGRKTVKLWDPLDDEIMSADQRELLLSYVGGRPTYRPSFEAKAMVFDLAPGLGVHHPFIAPHLVHTGPELSISLAITFRTRRSDTWTNAYRFNHRLRKLGLHPGPVGHHPLVDRTKSAVINSYRLARRSIARTEDDATTAGV